ncbi:Alpha/Beta hydrolase protein [Mycena albidolilacea]|uniref:Alpha/Beta hydrolase protein n=1 Tax=Mycena albidolilacea TaxID=1033008 RepID=A0AAD7ADD5_9AGAR|nr:Alpha/Beta hydrolase protein [Mycena albidolilacea]
MTTILLDGRIISYAIYGDGSPIAPTVFYFHGFPASHHEASLFDSPARKRGIRLIAPDRPGMGSSTFTPTRKITDWPADVLQLADDPAINAPTFAVLGTSGGGPYVLACCAAIPSSRLTTAGIIGGLYPPSLGLAGMLMEPRLLLSIAPRAPKLVEKVFDWGLVAAARNADQGKIEKIMASSMKGRPEPDRRAWDENEDGFREMLVMAVRGSVQENGGKGPAQGARLLGSPWGFELGDVKMKKGKLVLWHGGADANIPLTMVEKAHEPLAGSELRVG